MNVQELLLLILLIKIINVSYKNYFNVIYPYLRLVVEITLQFMRKERPLYIYAYRVEIHLFHILLMSSFFKFYLLTEYMVSGCE